MRTWEYNGVKLEVDLQDADFAERYEKAFNRMGEDEKKVPKDGTNSELIRAYCSLFYHLFDDIYGEGTSERLFGGKKNAGMCDEAYGAFIQAAQQCNADAAQRRNAFYSKYAPNRDQRRYHNRNNDRRHP